MFAERPGRSFWRARYEHDQGLLAARTGTGGALSVRASLLPGVHVGPRTVGQASLGSARRCACSARARRPSTSDDGYGRPRSSRLAREQLEMRSSVSCAVVGVSEESGSRARCGLWRSARSRRVRRRCLLRCVGRTYPFRALLGRGPSRPAGRGPTCFAGWSAMLPKMVAATSGSPVAMNSEMRVAEGWDQAGELPADEGGRSRRVEPEQRLAGVYP